MLESSYGRCLKTSILRYVEIEISCSDVIGENASYRTRTYLGCLDRVTVIALSMTSV
jgi:hypothetical protein